MAADSFRIGFADHSQALLALNLCCGLCRFTGAINRINSHVQGYVEAHSKGRIKFVDCRSFFLSESEDIDEELMPDSAYPNASGEVLLRSVLLLMPVTVYQMRHMSGWSM